ncbi:MAG: type I methionyl aminopeptidase [Coriobacteriales bacterium]
MSFRLRKDGIQLKTPQEIEAMREAGRVSALALRMVGDIIAPGVTTRELDSFVENVIRLEGGTPTFKGYGGFPGSICASVNEKVVHGIPSDDVILAEGDIISIDTGATVNGWVGDNAYTFAVGEVSSEKRQLCTVTREAMWAGIRAAWPGNTLGDVGFAVQDYAESRGFGVVRDYVGHGVGHVMHEKPDVPNYGKKGRGVKLKPGMVIAIEPMITAGSYRVRVEKDGWGVVTVDGKPAAHFENTIAITDKGPLVLTEE